MIITLYSKPLCPYCDGAEHYLKKNGFNYNKIDGPEKEGYPYKGVIYHRPEYIEFPCEFIE